jgi:hypothetical protein
LNKEGFTVCIDLLNIFDVLWVGLDVFDDFEAEKLDDNLNTLVTNHHFLMVGFDLVRVAGRKHLGQVGKHLCTFSLLVRIENSPKVFKISDINIVLLKIPTKELQITFFFFDFLEL